MRLIFFAEEPGTSIRIGDNTSEGVLFKGVDTRVEGHRGEPLLHFVRQVSASTGDADEFSNLDRPFDEHMWYAKAKGLVRLEQHINSSVTMTWVLDSVSHRN